MADVESYTKMPSSRNFSRQIFRKEIIYKNVWLFDCLYNLVLVEFSRQVTQRTIWRGMDSAGTLDELLWIQWSNQSCNQRSSLLPRNYCKELRTILLRYFITQSMIISHDSSSSWVRSFCFASSWLTERGSKCAFQAWTAQEHSLFSKFILALVSSLMTKSAIFFNMSENLESRESHLSQWMSWECGHSPQ